MSETLLNAQQAAELLNVPDTWVLAQARQDNLPHIRLGRYVRFDRDALIAWRQSLQQGALTHGGRS